MKILSKSRRQEKKIASKIGGRTRPASGAIPGMKGDVISKRCLVEAKRTDKTQITLKKAWLEKIRDEAFQARRMPVLAIQFRESENYILIRENDFLELLEVTI